MIWHYMVVHSSKVHLHSLERKQTFLQEWFGRVLSARAQTDFDCREISIESEQGNGQATRHSYGNFTSLKYIFPFKYHSQTHRTNKWPTLSFTNRQGESFFREIEEPNEDAHRNCQLCNASIVFRFFLIHIKPHKICLKKFLRKWNIFHSISLFFQDLIEWNAEGTALIPSLHEMFEIVQKILRRYEFEEIVFSYVRL